MTTTFTPGPWVFRKGNYSPPWREDCFVVETKFHQPSKLAEAVCHMVLPENARLIAAAPELLDALEKVLAAWQEDRTHNRRKWNVRRDFSMMVVESCARNLIHTIKGE